MRLAGPWKMLLVLVGGLGRSIWVRGLGPGTPAKLKQLCVRFPSFAKMQFGAWEPNNSIFGAIFGCRDGVEFRMW